MGCAEIESVAGKVGGRPVIKGTRIKPDVVLVDEEIRTDSGTDACQLSHAAG